MTGAAKRIFLVAGEHSGDHLGAALMRALEARLTEKPVYGGVGGDEMTAAGLTSLFPLERVAVMGVSAVLARLPSLVKRVWETADAAIAFDPDVVIAIDSPEFTHAVARRVRRRRSDVPIINYVSPSVWAWRSGRAARMRRYIDHVLALLPFEPAAHERLGGPPCSYVGHPLIEKYAFLKSCDGEALRSRLGIAPTAPVLAVLPGSRPSEIDRLVPPFGEAVERLCAENPDLQVVIPVVRSVAARLEARLADWRVRPHLVHSEADKFAAFNLATAALAASGTVTLELALAGVPMVVAYRVSGLENQLRGLVKVHSIVLANLVLGENLFPEYLQEDCTVDNLVAATNDLLHDTPAREKQAAGLKRIEQRMLLDGGRTPSEAAASVVLSFLTD